MNEFYVLAIIFTIFLLWFWVKTLFVLMNKTDDYFVGKNDKSLWFIVVFFGSFFGAFIFLLWNMSKNAPHTENPIEKELGIAFNSVIKSEEEKI